MRAGDPVLIRLTSGRTVSGEITELLPDGFTAAANPLDPALKELFELTKKEAE